MAITTTPDNFTPTIPAPSSGCSPPVSSAPASSVAVASAAAELLLSLLALSVSAGPSQCQWSPCGSQPTDSVGLGERLADSDSDASPSVTVVVEVDVASDSDSVVVAGASQCQWSPCGSQPIDSVGLGGRVSEVDSKSVSVDVAGASQCLNCVSKDSKCLIW